MDERIDGWTDRKIDRQKDGQTNGWADRHTDKWIGRQRERERQTSPLSSKI